MDLPARGVVLRRARWRCPVITRIVVGLALTAVALAIAARRLWWLKRLSFAGPPAPERGGGGRGHLGRGLAIAARRLWWLKRLAFAGQPAPERVEAVRAHLGRDLTTQATEVIGQRK